jgi:hypothetical protein
MRSLRNLPSDVRLWRWTALLLAVCAQACLNPIPDEEPSANVLAPDPVGAAGAANQPSTSGGMPTDGPGATIDSPPSPNAPESPAPSNELDSDSGPAAPDAGPAADAGASDGGT